MSTERTWHRGYWISFGCGWGRRGTMVGGGGTDVNSLKWYEDKT